MEEVPHNMQAEESKSSSKAIYAIIGMLLVLGLGLAIVSGSSKTKNSKAMPTASAMAIDESSDMLTPSSSSSAMPEVKDYNTNISSQEAVKTIAVEAGSFYYKPAQLTVKKGEKIKLVLTAVDMMHDFNIDELGVKVPITKSGGTNSVEFVADKTGTFEYYCSVGQHRSKGQVGKITIE